MALDAIAVARAFEVLLPKREDGGLTLMHNPHHDLAMDWEDEEDTFPIAEYLRIHNETEFTGPVEQQKIEATGEMWVLCWTAPGESKETRLAAASLPALAAWLQDNGLAFGS
jgi:hypothetical protein